MNEIVSRTKLRWERKKERKKEKKKEKVLKEKSIMEDILGKQKENQTRAESKKSKGTEKTEMF